MLRAGDSNTATKRSSPQNPTKDVEIKFQCGKNKVLPSTKPGSNRIKTSKYTLSNFLFKNLYEQLHKFGNVYFLIISVIMYLGEVTPLYVGTIKAFSTVGVLVMMMAVSAVMAGLDDLKRHANDREINHSQANCFRNKLRIDTKKWEDVNVGDVLVIRQDEQLPADMVLLYSSGADGNCHVSTTNLDGETDLKQKTAPSVTQARFLKLEEQDARMQEEGELWKNLPSEDRVTLKRVLPVVERLSGTVLAEGPNASIHQFTGSLAMAGGEDEPESLSASQLLLRGTVLRNTRMCIGIVVYCGGNSRMILNSRPAPLKVSSLEFFTNNSMKLILLAQALLALLSSLLHNHHKDYFQHLWYVFPRDDLWLWDIPAYWLTFFTLYSNLMPISLYPTTEFCNAMQSFFIRNDKAMCHEEDNGTLFAARARSSNLCTELGQVKYIFSDKTGTLTQNVMELKRLSINGRTYGEMTKDGFTGKSDIQSSKQDKGHKKMVNNFLEVLSVAHTVMATQKDGKPVYEAESPDEHALVTAAGDLGHKFIKRNGDALSCQIDGAEGRSYTILGTNAFSSARKRMSVVVKLAGDTTQPSKYMLFVKGADDVMLELAKGDHALLNAHLTEFSQEGLRTLVIGSKPLEEALVQDWVKKYEKAKRMTGGREEALEKVAGELEHSITLLGATAIEDKLQDEVPETIEKIRKAGIKLWILTGDKLETARNIGFSTKVLDSEMNVQVLDVGEDGGVSLDEAETNLIHSRSKGKEQALMVTGKQLAQILSEEGEKNKFLTLAMECKVLIACRVSPMQKAECVRLVRDGVAGKAQLSWLPWRRGRDAPITLAIGDGANDVPMLQEAQVGVGVAGREGRQSVNHSDFAVGQFKHLQHLLFVHGRWNYLRACKYTKFTFWRNMVQVLIMFFYTWLSGFSGTVLFEDWLRLTFNAFGSLPVLAVGAFDQDIDKAAALANPDLYEVGRDSQELNVRKTLETFSAALVHAKIIFGLSLLAYPGMVLYGAGDYYTFGSAVYTCLIVDLTYRVAFLTCSHNRYTMGAILFTLCGYAFFLLVYPCVKFMADIFEPNMYMVPYHMVSSCYFWIYLFAVLLLAMARDVLVSFAKQQLRPDAVTKYLQQRHCAADKPSKKHTTKRLNSRVLGACDELLEESQPLTVTAVPADSTLDDRERFRGQLDLSNYGQQTLPCTRVYFTRWRVVVLMAIIGGLLVLLGVFAYLQSQAAAQIRLVYAQRNHGLSNLAGERPMGTKEDEFFGQGSCGNHSSSNELVCHVRVPRAMKSPILVYYVLGNFYQNLGSYLKSEVSAELAGKGASESARSFKCRGKSNRMRGNISIVPCGAKATSLFNDTLEITGMDIDKTNVAWPTDVARYDNPKDYPNRSKTLWMHDLYPDVVSKKDGVKSEAFAQWMRPAALAGVWNAYGWLHKDLESGQTLTLKIKDEFVTPDGASKTFVLTERNLLGGRHDGLGVFLICCGVSCFVMMLGTLLFFKPKTRESVPRDLPQNL